MENGWKEDWLEGEMMGGWRESGLLNLRIGGVHEERWRDEDSME